MSYIFFRAIDCMLITIDYTFCTLFLKLKLETSELLALSVTSVKQSRLSGVEVHLVLARWRYNVTL